MLNLILNNDNNNPISETSNSNQIFDENINIQENIRINTNTISSPPPKEQNNLLYTNSYYFSSPNDNSKNIFNNTNCSSEKRNKYAYIRRTIKKNYENDNISIPLSNMPRLNCDDIAEKIINNLEIKINALKYENELLNQNLKNININKNELNYNNISIKNLLNQN